MQSVGCKETITLSDLKRSLAYITSGAAGMFCGSCMHDNTLARALSQMGIDIQLIPTYTPIRTDEEDVSIDRIFFGGINVFLEQTVPMYRFLPNFVGRIFDQPWVIRKLTARASSVNPKSLGKLTISMLRGTAGYQRREVLKLSAWLADSVRPDIVVFSNVLIAGCIPHLKRSLGTPILVTLQGDDIFLESLPKPFRRQALDEIRRLVKSIDGFLVHSQFYADRMGEYFGIPADKIHLVPLGIDTHDFPTSLPPFSERPADRPVAIGYLARLAKEKGLHVLVDAFIELHQRPETKDVQLRVAGWMGESNRNYAAAAFRKLDEAGLQDMYHYDGVVDRAGKVEFLNKLDLLSVPTTYEDPKGLFILESLAAGVPVVQPNHGAFPELLGNLGGGCLVTPNDPVKLADQLHHLLCHPEERRQLAEAGHAAVHTRFSAPAMAQGTWKVIEERLNSTG
jgi:glycosyltransferase involved in cell wall biosynthesis